MSLVFIVIGAVVVLLVVTRVAGKRDAVKKAQRDRAAHSESLDGSKPDRS